MKSSYLFNAFWLMVLMVCSAGFADVSWDHVWEADELPEDFLVGTVFEHTYYIPTDTNMVRSISDGVYTTETTADPCNINITANSFFTTKTGVFDPCVASTIEFRYRADVEVKPYINYITVAQENVGRIAFNFQLSHQVRNQANSSQYFFAYKDLEGWSTFRILTTVSGGNLTGGTIYYKDADGIWVEGITVGLTSNPTQAASQITFGDGGGNWGGTWSVDYFAWTGQAATLDDIPLPEIPDWAYVWECDILPEEFKGGSVLSHIPYVPADTDLERVISDGVYTTETKCLISGQTTPNANSFVKALSASGFDPSKASTIEFKYRADAELKPYINFMVIGQQGVGELGFNFRQSHQVLNRYDGSQNFIAYKDLDGWSVFRILTKVSSGNLTGADIYYKDGDDEWVHAMTVAVHVNTGITDNYFNLGDGGSNWGGRWSVDYIAWTSEGSTLKELDMPKTANQWDYSWDADQFPEAYVAGSILGHVEYAPVNTTVIRSIDEGIYTFETTADGATNANCSVVSGVGKFDAYSPSTIEFRYKAILDTKPYISSLWLFAKDYGEIHINLLLTHQVNDGRDTGNNFVAYKDAQGWTTFRILTNLDTDGFLESADIYYKDADGFWRHGINVPVWLDAGIAPTNKISLGDGGSNWAGKCSLDYVYWTSTAATLGDLAIAPEPIRSDIDDDGDVDFDDFAMFSLQWMTGVATD